MVNAEWSPVAVDDFDLCNGAGKWVLAFGREGLREK